MSDITERNCSKCIHHTSGMCDSWNCKMQTVEDVKKEAVNEYVKSVVEELESEKSIHTENYNISLYKDYPEIKQRYRQVCGVIDKAIEIVKQCGVSDDVCEWMLCDEEANVYDTSCRNPHILIEGTPKENNYEYCPYCGKKIKVVDK